MLSHEDCDNANPNSNAIADDADCDGLLTAEDCDDSDPYATSIANDADCDGAVTADDCDDTDPIVLLFSLRYVKMASIMIVMETIRFVSTAR